MYGRIRRNLSHGCRCDSGTRRVREGSDSRCCLCWSSTFLQSVGQNIRAVLQLAGRRTPVIACQALLIGMARNTHNVPGWDARVRPQRNCCCSNTMVRILLGQASPDRDLLHDCRKLVDSKWLVLKPHWIGLFELFPWLLKESLLPWVELVEVLAKARKRIAVLTCAIQAGLSLVARFVGEASLMIL